LLVSEPGELLYPSDAEAVISTSPVNESAMSVDADAIETAVDSDIQT
jgi:hypothetical protein